MWKLFVLCVPLAVAQQWIIVPGSGVGRITASSTREQVRKLFPPGEVRDDQIELDEGMLQDATLVYRSDPSRTLAISWNANGHPKQVFVCFGRRRGPCQWKTSNGIGIGTRLSELEAMNGKAFTVSGFGYNYGGNVEAWNGGKLEKFDCNGRVVLTLDGDRERGGDYSVELTPEERHSISGDRPISSGVPAMRKLNPGVVGMLYRFTGKKCP